MNLTKRPVFQKGQTQPKTRKPLKARKTKRQHEAGKMFVSPVLRAFAEGKPCQMMGENCNGIGVVLCHSRRRFGAGMGQKPHDFWAYHGCEGCHRNEAHAEDRELMDAIMRTQRSVYAEFGTLTP